jgi:hypothetical protein
MRISNCVRTGEAKSKKETNCESSRSRKLTGMNVWVQPCHIARSRRTTFINTYLRIWSNRNACDNYSCGVAIVLCQKRAVVVSLMQQRRQQSMRVRIFPYSESRRVLIECLTARVIQEELLDEFSRRNNLSYWYDREDTVPTVLIKKPHPRNIQNAEKLQQLEAELARYVIRKTRTCIEQRADMKSKITSGKTNMGRLDMLHVVVITATAQRLGNSRGTKCSKKKNRHFTTRHQSFLT